MTTPAQRAEPENAGQPSWSEQEQPQIQAHLSAILTSPQFRGSKRCQDFLSFAVLNVLAGRRDCLKERTIGVEVFQREPAYDTNNDAVVRVRANEVRKRLAQYYQGTESSPVRISLPPGGYVPEIVVAAKTGSDAQPESRKSLRRRPLGFAAAAGVLGVCLAVLILNGRGGVAPAVEEFWRPLANSGQPVLIALGNSRVYVLSREAQIKFRPNAQKHAGDWDEPIELPADGVLSTRDIVSAQGEYVGVGGGQAILRFTALLTSLHRGVILRAGNEISYSDLRDHPSILVGAFSNRWTQQLTRNMRFHFVRHGADLSIADESTQQLWTASYDRDRRKGVDYAMVARVLQPSTGQPFVVASGIMQQGCTAAAEFLTESEYFGEAVREFPAGWQARNLQLVLRTEILGGTPGKPRIVARHLW